ncbi:ABC transporter permease [Pseudoroseicyclus sp. CXY001]|uniref:ABC transporter permease n=1 Tax=Pseudoroseicyclus sp. CXY001 TaxID=3242492 RepID=UPI00358DBE5C
MATEEGGRVPEMTGENTAARMVAADGRPLKRSLARALRREKLRALMLIAPLLIFILVAFVAPIVDMLFRSVENGIVSDTLPRTTAALEDWDPEEAELPPDAVYDAFYTDLVVAEELKLHTRLGTRLNYELTGISSMFRSTGRAVGRFETDIYTDQFIAADPEFERPVAWVAWMNDDAVREALPQTASAWEGWRDMLDDSGDEAGEEDVPDFVFAALYRDALAGGLPDALPQVDVSGFESVSIREQFAEADEEWLDPEVWETIKVFSPDYTPGYFLNSADLQLTPQGSIEQRPEGDRIYMTLFGRTMWMSLVITVSCILLGYPVAWMLANLPMRSANLLMILVLLPFWTSLLVRTSAWKVLLQQQGVINDILVWAHIISDGNRLVMINNATGTIIAMTHILLPFMILPLYSVMKTIPPSYLRAAKSLGATNWTAFWRVYFPQSVPGIGAGSILVFILAIGYYITPELVGGTKGVFISNRIAYHISQSLNWGLAAALGTILLVLVLLLYWVYDKLVGIDNVSLG